MFWKRLRRYKWVAAAAVTGGVVGAVVVHHNATVTNITVCHSNNQLPDPTCTPGVVDPAVTQDNIQQTICTSGYTATVRPPVSVTGPEKTQSMKEYGYPAGTVGEYDHLIPLELGGSSSTHNLWFEAGPIPNPKDSVENELHRRVCAGQMTLLDAQHRIATDWTKALQ